MLHLNQVHHVAIICGDYEKSKQFYTEIIGLRVIREVYRAERNSYKLDLALNGNFIIELFSFPDPPKRLSRPEGRGLRHLAFEVNDINQCVEFLKRKNIHVEPVRIDEFTNKKFTFFPDPDDLPIELYEV